MLSGVTSDLLNRSPILRIHIDRQRARVARRDAAGDRAGARERVQPAAGLDDLHADERVLVVMETVPSAQLDATALEHFFVPARGRTADSADRRRVLRADDGPAERGAFGADGVGDDLVQSRGRRVARRGDGRGRAASRGRCCRRRSPAGSRAPRRRSRIRSREWACCC